jgi:YidC/Oxa1 family membrane protein insertase
MSALISPIALFFGEMLLLLYNNLWFNFGLAIIVLTILMKVALLPLGVKSFNSMIKMSELQPLMSEIQRKYKKDPETMNKEVMKLYQEKKANPFGGCLPLLIQLPIFIGLLWVMSQPLTYMFKYNNNEKNSLIVQEIYRNIDVLKDQSTEIKSVKDLLKNKIEELRKTSGNVSETEFKNMLSSKINEEKNLAGSIIKNSADKVEVDKMFNNILGKTRDYYLQIKIIKDEPSENLSKIHKSMNFLGINLTDVPPNFYSTPVNAKNVILLPILAGVSTFLSSKYSQLPVKKEEQTDTQAAMQKQMLVMMPLMSAWFSFVVPIGLSLYWLISNIFQLVQQKVMIDMYLRKKEGKA